MLILAHFQPTGGPLLLQDTQADEPKELIEEKLKKVTTEKAPVAGAHAQSGASGRARDAQSLLQQTLRGQGGDIRSINDLFRQTGQAGGLASLIPPVTPARGGGNEGGGPPTDSGSGAAAAAGVLTAIDEDQEGDEEAPLPEDFEYFTDAAEEDE